MVDTVKESQRVAELWNAVRRTLLLGFVVWLLAGCLGFYCIFYYGQHTRYLPHDRLVDAITAGENLPATTNEARDRVNELIRAVRLQVGRDGRDGLAARIALEHIRKEANR